MAWHGPIAVTLGINDVPLVDVRCEVRRELGGKLFFCDLFAGFYSGQVTCVGTDRKCNSVQGKPTPEPDFSERGMHDYAKICSIRIFCTIHII